MTDGREGTDCPIRWIDPAIVYRAEDIRVFLEVSEREWKRWIAGELGKKVLPGTRRDFLKGHDVIQFMENRRAESQGDPPVRAPAFRVPLDGPLDGQDQEPVNRLCP